MRKLQRGYKSVERLKILFLHSIQKINYTIFICINQFGYEVVSCMHPQLTLYMAYK